MWQIARFKKMGSAQQFDQWLKQRSVELGQRYFPDDPSGVADEIYKYVIDNLKTVAEDPRKLTDMMITAAKSRAKKSQAKKTVPAKINQRRSQYNQQQAASNYANSTPDTYRTQNDPMTLQNRMSQDQITQTKKVRPPFRMSQDQPAQQPPKVKNKRKITNLSNLKLINKDRDSSSWNDFKQGRTG